MKLKKLGNLKNIETNRRVDCPIVEWSSLFGKPIMERLVVGTQLGAHIKYKTVQEDYGDFDTKTTIHAEADVLTPWPVLRRAYFLSNLSMVNGEFVPIASLRYNRDTVLVTGDISVTPFPPSLSLPLKFYWVSLSFTHCQLVLLSFTKFY